MNDRHDQNSYLVVAFGGDSSNYSQWTEPKQFINFDLYLYDQEDKGEHGNDSITEGNKWSIIKNVMEKLGEDLFRYDAVWFPDAEVRVNAFSIHQMFEIFTNNHFDLAQPALTHDSGFEDPFELESPDFSWRFTKIVNPAIPIFSRGALKKVSQHLTYHPDEEIVEQIGANSFGFSLQKIAIIDETPVTIKRTRARKELFSDHGYFDGQPRNKRVMFALLVHQDEYVVKAQIENIRRFNPDAGILLFNGGNDDNFAKTFNLPICPYSRPLKWAFQTPFFWGVMKWLEECNVEYEYLINLDHDVLFIKEGFESFLDVTMKNYDCMGWDLLKSNKDEDLHHYVIQAMSKEWHLWQPIFRTDYYLRYFNPVQVYRQDMIRKIIHALDHDHVERMMDQTNVFALEEVFFCTMAMACGGRLRKYPRDFDVDVVTLDRVLSKEEIFKAMHHPYYYWIHPVKGDSLIQTHNWILSTQSSSTNQENNKHTRNDSRGSVTMNTSESRIGNRYLVIARVGDTSLHHEWLTPAESKDFDVCLSYYGEEPGRYSDQCDFYFQTPGVKWPKIKEIIDVLGERINQYEAIWIPDDDISTDARNISNMFRIFSEQGFYLAQPALTPDSYYSHQVTQCQEDYAWRYTHFVEVMVPIFSKEAFKVCWTTFEINQTGWGLDLLWPKLLGFPNKKIAIIDETPVKHARPLGSGTLYKVASTSKWKDLRRIEKKYGVQRATYNLMHYGGVFKTNDEIMLEKQKDTIPEPLEIQNVTLKGNMETARRGTKKRARIKTKRDAREKAKKEPRRKAEKEAEEKEKREARRKAEKEAKEKEKREAGRKAEKEAEEKEKREARRKAKKEAEEKEKREARRKAEKEAEKKEKREARRKAEKEAEEKEKREARRKAKKEAREKEKREARRKAEKEAREKEKREARRKAKKEAKKELINKVKKVEKGRFEPNRMINKKIKVKNKVEGILLYV